MRRSHWLTTWTRACLGKNSPRRRSQPSRVDAAQVSERLESRVLLAATLSAGLDATTIGAGNVSTLTYTLTNLDSEGAVTDLGFTVVLPTGVTVADVPNSQSTVGGTVTATAGGNTITFAGGVLAASGSETVSIDVTSNAVGIHTIESSDLTSSAGTASPASVDLTVDTERPRFSMELSSSTAILGERLTLTYTIDNSESDTAVTSFTFTDTLSEALILADPVNPSNDVNNPLSTNVFTAVPGTRSVTFNGTGVNVDGFRVIEAGETAQFSVDVIVVGTGQIAETSGPLLATLTAGATNVGKANALLDVAPAPVTMTTTFTNDPVTPGGSTTLEVTLTNRSRDTDATDLAFTLDLEAMLPGLTAVQLPTNGSVGAGSTVTGTSQVTLQGGSLAASESIIFTIVVEVPTGAASGEYVLVASPLTGNLGDTPFSETIGGDNLFVVAGPSLSMTFLNGPVKPGDPLTVRFEITNTSPSFEATGIAFQNELTFLPSGAVIDLPANGFLGAGSTISVINVNPSLQALQISDGTLAAGETLTFDVTFHLPDPMSTGTYTSTTGVVTSVVNGEAVTTPGASDDFDVVSAPTLSMAFGGPVTAGETVLLQFTLDYSENSPAPATDVAFSVDLDSILAGLTAVGLPQGDVCGPGSVLSGTSTIVLTGGSLQPGESQSFSVEVLVPADAAAGQYDFTSSEVSATVDGLATTRSGASASLEIALLSFGVTILDGPAVPGGSVTVQFQIENHSDFEATDLSFTANLNQILSGTTATGLPLADPVGAGSSLSLTGSILSLTGGTLQAGQSATFEVTLEIPDGATPESYRFLTSPLSGTVDGSGQAVAAASANFEVIQPIGIQLEFPDGPAVAGGTSTLRVTLTNLHPSQSLTDLTFTADLDAALAGLVAVGLPLNDICGPGSQLSGTSLLTLTTGSVGPGGSVSFDIELAIPESASAGSFELTTSSISGTLDTTPVERDPVSATLVVATTVSIDDVTQLEGTNGATDFVFTVTRSDNTSSFSVDYRTVADTAGAGQDFVAIGRSTLEFETGGALTQTVIVTVAADVLEETDETFFVELFNASGVVLVKAEGLGTILDDDARPQLDGIETEFLPFFPGGAPRTVTSTLTLSDADSTNLQSATVQILGIQPGDLLTFQNTANITGTWNGVDTLTLTGTDTLANYEAALRSIQYSSTSQNPAVRTVRFLVHDGGQFSNAVTRDVGGPVQLVGTTLSIFGTSQVDLITITSNATLNVAWNGTTFQFNPADVSAIQVFAGADHDTVQIDSLAAGTTLQVFGQNGNDALRVHSSVTRAVLLNGGEGNDLLLGGAGNDQLIGGGGNDWLNGGEGSDTYTGGAGNDTYDFSAASANQTDQIVEVAGEGIDVLRFEGLTTSVVVNLTSTTIATMAGRIVTASQPAQFENVSGGSGNDQITGNAAANTLIGNGGNDVISGGDGNDELIGGEGNDTLNGGNHNDVLDGGAGNDFLNGGEGNDRALGGIGDDTYLFAAAIANQTDVVTENAAQGIDLLNFSSLTTSVTVSLTSDTALATMAQRIVQTQAGLAANFENATTGSGNDSLTGNDASNLLSGGLGNDTLIGNGGNDILIGGGGGDVLRGISGRNLLIGGQGADLIFGGTGDDLLLSSSTIFDTNTTALLSLLAEWTQASSIQTRVSHLRGQSAGGVNTVFLNANTVQADADKDTLTGGTGADWFLANALSVDTLTDRGADDIFTVIDTWL